MSVYFTNFDIHKGTDFDKYFTLYNDASKPIDLSFYSIKAKIRKNYTSVGVITFSVDTTHASDGIIKLSLSKEETQKLSDGRNVFDVLITGADNKTLKPLRGSVIVKGTASL